ncbi:MAG: pyrrolo-quinoline quinone [Acidobacteriia bacterium]|nr:pyrrolo-quinoline quinone [Terriglobia bacterium]
MVLTPTNVNAAQFGKLFSYPLDGVADASSLYVANVSIPGQGFHNVVYVATEHDTVYAFDADGLNANPLWKVSFINPAGGITTVPPGDTGECCDISPEIGITGSPVINPATGTLYVVAKTKEVSGSTTNYVHRLHALDIATGAEKFGGPVVIQASVPGTGDGSSGGQTPFISLRENQRAALLLSNSVVYFAFAAHGDQPPYHGWVLGYNAATLQQTMVYNSTPNGSAGGIWQSGDGLATDSTGNIYFVTGNGDFNANSGGSSYGDSFVKLSPSGAVVDYFTPHDQAIMQAGDLDLGSGGTLLLPDQSGPHPHLAISAGKNGTMYLVDRDNMGRYNANNDNQIVQALVNEFPNGTFITGNFKAPLYFNGSVYFSADADNIKSFKVTNGLLSTSPTSETSLIPGYPGATLSFSANGNTNGILWAVQRIDFGPTGGGGPRSPGVLHAYDAANLATELYNSNQAAGSRDTLDFAAKWSAALVANGKVFVATNAQLTVFSLLP